MCALVPGAVALPPGAVVLGWMFEIGRGGILRDSVDAVGESASAPPEDDDIADMPAIVDGDEGQGAVSARWSDSGETRGAIVLEAVQLGRVPDCRSRFDDPFVSRKHARIHFDGGEWRIEDLGSRNGTLVDGQPIESAVLPRKCEVRVNEAGPVLHFERVAPGAEMRRALATFPPGPRVAHVRNQSTGVEGRSDLAARETSRKR